MLTAHYRSSFPLSPADLYAWHERPGALERLVPPWPRVTVLEEPEGLEEGARAVLAFQFGPFRKQWVAEHFDIQPGVRFRDRQVEGPFAEWTHTHRCEAGENGGSVLHDEICYRLPPASLHGRLGAGVAGHQMDRLFFYRHATMQSDFRHFGSGQPGTGKTILVTGHTGLIGQRLLPLLRTLGFTVRGLTRSPRAAHEFFWDYEKDELDPGAMEDVDAVVHLAGENVAGGRWTAPRCRRIMESRKQGTALVARTMANASRRPETLISVSGANFYAADGSPQTEAGARGDGFLSEVCAEWEAAADPARSAGIRVVHPRLGVVLSPEGGALAKMLPAFLAGAGGPVGSGQQHFPWSSVEDVLGVIVEALVNPAYSGPLNVCAPERVTQREFARVLGRVLGRPTVIPVPASVVKTLFGQMGEETLLADLDIVPAALEESGYAWRHPHLEQALRVVLGRPRSEQIPDGGLPGEGGTPE